MSDTEHITYSVESNAVYAIVAIAALTLYDHILTLPQEIDHIWRRKVTGVTVLFVANRYITLCMIFLVFQSTWSDSVSACSFSFTCYNALDSIVTFVDAIFNALRIWAIWDRKWLPALFIFALSIVTPGYNVYRVSQNSVLPEVASFPLPLGGCLINLGMTSTLWEHRTVAIATDAIIIVMTWVKTYGAYKSALRVGVRPRITTLLLRDGTLYFGALFVVNTIMLALNSRLSRYTPLSPIPSRSMHIVVMLFLWPHTLTAVLISRFLLNIRSAYTTEEPERPDTTTVGFGPFKVPVRVIGDLGGNLEHSYDDDDYTQTPMPINRFSQPEDAGYGRRQILYTNSRMRNRLNAFDDSYEMGTLDMGLP